MDNHLSRIAHGETILPVYRVDMERVNSFFLWKREMRSTERKAKKEGRKIFFHSVRGRAVTRVYPQREYERNVYMYLAILYLVPRRELPFIFRQRGVIALSEKAGISGKCKETGAGVFERTIAGETHTPPRLHVRY